MKASTVLIPTLVIALLADPAAAQQFFAGDAAPPSSRAFRHLFAPAEPNRVEAGNRLRLSGCGAALQGCEHEQPPEPSHSGFKALFKASVSDFVAFPRRTSTWVILGVGVAGTLMALPVDDYVEDHIVGSTAAENFFAAGKVIGSFYFQLGAAVGLYVVGRYVLPPAEDGSRTNKVSHIGFDLIRAQILSQALVQVLKLTVRRDRPDGECCAFPSGHAAAAFASASVVERHFGYRGAWPTIVIATYVATSRLVDNRHFLSDVIFGSALGLASGWTVVGSHGRSTYTLVPVPVKGGAMVAFTRVDRPRGAAPL